MKKKLFILMLIIVSVISITLSCDLSELFPIDDDTTPGGTTPEEPPENYVTSIYADVAEIWSFSEYRMSNSGDLAAFINSSPTHPTGGNWELGYVRDNFLTINMFLSADIHYEFGNNRDVFGSTLSVLASSALAHKTAIENFTSSLLSNANIFSDLFQIAVPSTFTNYFTYDPMAQEIYDEDMESYLFEGRFYVTRYYPESGTSTVVPNTVFSKIFNHHMWTQKDYIAFPYYKIFSIYIQKTNGLVTFNSVNLDPICDDYSINGNLLKINISDIGTSRVNGIVGIIKLSHESNPSDLETVVLQIN